jgi:hypothetical protein
MLKKGHPKDMKRLYYEGGKYSPKIICGLARPISVFNVNGKGYNNDDEGGSNPGTVHAT